MPAIQNQDFIPIPSVPSQVNPRFYPDSPLLPNAIYSNEKRDDVRMQKLGSRNWLVVPEPVTTAWPKLKQFFADNGVSLVLDEPSQGRLDTEWLTINSEETYRDVVREVLKGNVIDSERNRFLVKLEQGLRVGTSEIHMRHESEILEDIPTDLSEIFWKIKSDSLEAERSLLNEKAYIAAKVSEMSFQMALEIGTMQNPNFCVTVMVTRSWRLVGFSEKDKGRLGNAEADITELNRDEREFK